MMRVLKIALLWFAGILVLGHNIVPHHHHKAEQQHCAEENKIHKHYHTIISDASCCDHNETNSKACTIDQHTLVKDYSATFLLASNEIFKLTIPQLKTQKLAYQQIIGNVQNTFFGKRPSRAPPIA